VKNVIVRVTQTVAPGSVFVPFHYNTELINELTASCFDPISGEPNYKQTAIQLHSKKLPDGIVMNKEEISGMLAYQKIGNEVRKIETKSAKLKS
jgi:assimilatory nitrate reductase catalytic subunit